MEVAFGEAPDFKVQQLAIALGANASDVPISRETVPSTFTAAPRKARGFEREIITAAVII